MAKILIVDDNESFRRLSAMVLGVDGHDIVTASSGRDALSAVRAERPDIVLLDVMMPGMDGYQVCRQIKGNPHTRGITVVMVTALPPSKRFESFRAGADAHLTKQDSSSQIRNLVRKLLNKRGKG